MLEIHEGASFRPATPKRVGELLPEIAHSASQSAAVGALGTLGECERMYRTLIESLPQKIAHKDRNSVYVTCNSSFARDLKIQPFEIAGKTDHDFFAKELAEKYRADDRRVMESGEVAEIEEEYVHDGQAQYVHTVKSPVRDKAGNVTGVIVIFWDVSVRRRAEEAVQRASGYNRRLIEASLDPMVTISPDGKITDVNHASELVTGCGRDELIGADFCEFFTDQEKAAQGYRQAFGEGSVKGYELQIRRRDGHITPVLYNASVYRDEAGEVVGVFAAARDVTEKKRAEALQAHLASIVASAGTAIIGKDLDGIIVSWNHGATQLYGYTAYEMIGRSVLHLAPPDRSAELAKLLKRIAAGEQISQHETVRVRKDGRHIDVSISISPVRDLKGHVVAASTIASDISARKRTEDELRLSRERLALAQKAGHSGTFDWDIRNNANVWTPEVEALYGVEPGKFGGRYEDWEPLVLPEDLERARACLEKSLRTGEFSAEWRIRRLNDGEVRWIAAGAKVFFDETGRPARMIGINTDITERKREQQVLEESAKELARSNLELQQFAYVASHDLQEPLRMVANFTQLLADRYSDKLDQDAREFIAYAVEGATRMQTMIQDLLAFSRVGTRGNGLEMTRLDELLGRAVADLQFAIHDAGALVTHDELPAAKVDPSQMAQLLQNLIGNAIKFKGAEPLRVHVSAVRNGDEWTFSVRDNGIGFEPQYAERIFALFQRLHTRDEYPGTGIGLAICRKIVERHHGRIWAESRPGAGSTFFFTIPAAQIPVDEAKQTAAGAA